MGSSDVAGMAADKARVGNVVWALVAAEFCQKKMPLLRIRSSRKIIKTVRKTDRDEFTMKIPVQNKNNNLVRYVLFLTPYEIMLVK